MMPSSLIAVPLVGHKLLNQVHPIMLHVVLYIHTGVPSVQRPL
jgi:hypothetical protein